MKNSRGFSIVEAVVGLAIVGVAAGAVTYMTLKNQAQLVKIESASSFDASLARSLESFKSVMTNTVDGYQGLCRTMSTKMTTGGIGLISANLPAATSTIFNPDWDRVFPTSNSTPRPPNPALIAWVDVTPGSDPGCPAASATSYTRCYKPKSETALPLGLTPELFKFSPVYRFVITPVKARAQNGAYTPIPLSSTNDARDTALLMTAQVTYSDADKTIRHREQMALVWYGEYSCRVRLGISKSLLLNPSGIGSGSNNLADTNTVFSSTVPSSDTVLSGTFQVTSYTEGKVVAQQRAETLDDKDHVATAACGEHIYRCPGSTAPRQWIDSISSGAIVRYNPNNGKIDATSILGVPSVSFENKRNKINLPAAFTRNGVAIAPTGAALLNAPINIRATATGAADKVCPQVCTAATNYNASSGPDPYKISYNFQLPGYPKFSPVKVTDSAPAGCICCYGKQCAAIGTKITSWCSEQPPEPVDSRVPECAAASAVDGPQSYSTAPVSQVLELRGLGAPTTCLAVSLSGSKLIVEPASCTQQLPYLCYSQGTFRVARSTGAASDGAQACYNLGWETATKSEVDDRLAEQGNYNLIAAAGALPPVVGTNYRFLNSALAGQFLAPQTQIQISDAIRAISGTVGSGNKVWIALRGQGNQVLAQEPMIPATTSANSSFFDSRGYLIFVKDPDLLNFKDSSPTAMVLHHSRRYFGAKAVNPTQSVGLPALCWDFQRQSFFPSLANPSAANPTLYRVMNVSDAAQACVNNGRAFVRPRSPQQWSNALLAVKAPDEKLPWPIRDQTTILADSAWVAATPDGSTWKNLSLLPPSSPAPSYRINPAGAAVPASVTKNSDFHLCRRSSGSLELSSSGCASGDQYAYEAPATPITEEEELAIFQTLSSRGALGNGTVIQILPTPPPPPAPSPEPSSSPSGKI